MPPVAAIRSPSKSASERSSSATGDGSSRNGPVGSSPKVALMARTKRGHSSAVIGRSWSAISDTGAVYRSGPTLRQRVPGDNGPVTQTRSWAEMLTSIEQRLVAATGDDVATWADRVRKTGLQTEPEVRTWLADHG